MYNNIKSKTLGVCKRSLLLVLIIVTMFTIVACNGKDEVTTEEFEIVSCYIEFRNRTNGFGGITGTEEYFHYGYVDDNGKVIFDETRFGNHLDLKITDGTPKVIITTSKHETDYAFELTREMYKNLSSSQD